MGDHCTSSQRLRAWVTVSWMRWAISSMVRLGMARCSGEVPMKVWMRGFLAWRTASQARSISLMLARERPQITAFCDWRAISETASKSPSEAIGKPASMISTPIVSSSWAISSFSSMVMEAPGDCSPSRRVVSKIFTRSRAGLVDWSVIGSGLLPWGLLRRGSHSPERARRQTGHAQGPVRRSARRAMLETAFVMRASITHNAGFAKPLSRV